MRTPPNTKAACRLPRARTPADATAADGRASRPTRLTERPPAGLPAGSCPSPNKQPKKLFETLAARRQHGDRIKTPREPFSSYKRTKTKCSRDALRRARHFSFVPREQSEKAETDEWCFITSDRDGRRASRRTKSETSQKRFGKRRSQGKGGPQGRDAL